MKVRQILGVLGMIVLTACQPNSMPLTEIDPPVLPRVTIGDQTFDVEVADNPVKRQIGLMWRESMPANQGMLFVFERTAKHSFWMKNTLIPLDLIWISDTGKVVDVKTAYPCPPETETCPSFQPIEPALYVLEVNAGSFTGNIGDKFVQKDL